MKDKPGGSSSRNQGTKLDVEVVLKKKRGRRSFRDGRKIARDRDVEIDPEGGQVPAWTAQPVEEEMKEGCYAELRPSNAVVNIPSWRLDCATGVEVSPSIRFTYNKSLLEQHTVNQTFFVRYRV
jgi:hypothetical protein